MNRRADDAVGLCDQLAFEHPFAYADDWLRRIAGVLRDGQCQLSGNRDTMYRLCRRS